MPVESTRPLVALVWLMVGGLVSSLSGHTRSTSHWPDWLTKASTLLYHVRVPALTIVLYSHSTMVKRRTALTEHAAKRSLGGM